MKWLKVAAAAATLAVGVWVGGLAALFVSGYLLDKLDLFEVTGDSPAELAFGITWPLYPATIVLFLAAWLLLARPRRFWVLCLVAAGVEALVWLAVREGWLLALTAIAAGIIGAAVFSAPRFSRRNG
jgi:hypothetical protein